VSAGNLNVIDQGMVNASAEFASKVSEFGGHRAKVGSELEEINMYWQGSSATVFQNTMAQWQESFTRVISALERIQQTMDQTIAGYNTGEEGASDAVSQLNKNVPGAQGLPGF
jgi:WXG100 family type VII secretion target